jgi:hypothetical protein
LEKVENMIKNVEKIEVKSEIKMNVQFFEILLFFIG